MPFVGRAKHAEIKAKGNCIKSLNRMAFTAIFSDHILLNPKCVSDSHFIICSQNIRLHNFITVLCMKIVFLSKELSISFRQKSSELFKIFVQ